MLFTEFGVISYLQINLKSKFNLEQHDAKYELVNKK